MAVVTIVGLNESGWVCNGTGSNWYAEKPVQCGGKWLAVASTSDTLINAMNNIEYNAEGFGTHGPKSSSFNGHV